MAANGTISPRHVAGRRLEATNGVNGESHLKDSNQHEKEPGETTFKQVPTAVVGMACRLPDACNSPTAFWKFLEKRGIAKNEPPASRFDLATHYDGSLIRTTMASPGGMFLQDVDPRDIDAQFFKLTRMEAVSMDPQQRQLLEVVYEGLENAGITLEELSGKNVGCFVASFACDYADMQARDPEDRAPTSVIGTGRTMLSNRISHFLNITGPSLTIDTACSGGLTCLDVAMRYLQSGEISGAIVAGCNLYMSPEWVMDHHMGANGTASLSGKCHSFDAKADGYIKAEAVNMVYLQRLGDAKRNNSPIRAVIKGSSSNSDGWTPGIAFPNSESQSKAIRQAYKNAGISDFSQTSYLECHGTGTRAGDGVELAGAATVLSDERSPNNPLLIGSAKSNVGHSEPGAGLTALIKTILSLERGIIPGNPTFETPNPNIDFERFRMIPSQANRRWPIVPFKRASINSFGYGGSNAHVVVDAAAEGIGRHVSSYRTGEADLFAEEDEVERPYILTLSASDEPSLQQQMLSLDRHLSDTAVDVTLRDLAYTLSSKRSRLHHRAYAVATSNSVDLQSFVHGSVAAKPPSIGYVFTGQGAQWPQMGKDLISTFPIAESHIRYLDSCLQDIPEPPPWSLLGKLVEPQKPEQMRLPEISQPLCTALQLALLAVFQDAGIKPHAVVGHSSGEIAAAVAAGYITSSQAIKIAYYRGKASSKAKYDAPVGMLVAGVGPENVASYLAGTSVQVACFNSPTNLTLSGWRSDLEALQSKIKTDGHFARLLHVDAAYHSKFMDQAAEEYQELLDKLVEWPEYLGELLPMYSSTTGKEMEGAPGSTYWTRNMTSPVMFSQATQLMLSEPNGVDLLVELGPSNALAGPINQIKAALSKSTEYAPAWKRGGEAIDTLLSLAGKLYLTGAPIDLGKINQDRSDSEPSVIVDLPNYSWNHSTKYWHESEASKDWRFRKFLHHDLLGSKILSTPWTQPVWKKSLSLPDFPWLRDHRLGGSVIFPASGFIASAIEALFQKSKATGQIPVEAEVDKLTYKLRDVEFSRALPLEDGGGKDTKIILALNTCKNSPWEEFKVSSINKDLTIDHCKGRICLADDPNEVCTEKNLEPLSLPSPASQWYKAMTDAGYGFGDNFKRLLEVETVAGSRNNRGLLSLAEPEGTRSVYPIHPVTLDACLQSPVPSLWTGFRTSIDKLLLPAMIDEICIAPRTVRPERAIIVAGAEPIKHEVARSDDIKRYCCNVSTYTEGSGELISRVQGIHYHTVDVVKDNRLDHVYTYQSWQPDISIMTKDQLATYLQKGDRDLEIEKPTTTTANKLAKTINLVAHKKPIMRILEVNLVGSDGFWLDHAKSLASDTAKDCEYFLSVPTDDASLEAHRKYGTQEKATLSIHQDGEPFGGFDTQEPFDVVIVKTPSLSSEIQAKIQEVASVMCVQAYLFVLSDVAQSGQVNGSGHDGDAVATSKLSFSGFEDVFISDCCHEAEEDTKIAFFSRELPSQRNQEAASKEVHLVSFNKEQHDDRTIVADSLTRAGWTVTKSWYHEEVPEGSTLLVIDEMFSPLFDNISDDHYNALHRLLQQKCRVLWVSAGAQMEVSNPERSMFVGVSRALHAEDPSAMIATLDVESSSTKAGIEAIDSVLSYVNTVDQLETNDYEFVERSGMLWISRVLPDDAVIQSERENLQGAPSEMSPLYTNEKDVRLITNRPGTVDSLQWQEFPVPDINDDEVEVEVHAAVMNFKDLANVMGFVSANEHQIGLECAGYVTRVGLGVQTEFQRGDRVILTRRDGGVFANRVKARHIFVQKIPDWLGFEDASTLSTCYSTAIHALIDIAQVQKGQIVLIHSASGGVGLACIELCRHFEAEIYVTVGSDRKRDYLKETFGIPDDRIFSSRSVTFAPKFMAATGGQGADVIINSLTGDMLHESWRCISSNGTFIEIGKKDLIDRNSLSLEPFNRNASYRAFDLSLSTEETSQRLLAKAVELVNSGVMKPLHICKTFTFDQITDAFRFMRDGKHLGKIVIRRESEKDIMVPVVPAPIKVELRSDATYLISGGLKGICGSLAVFLARHGAKHLTVVSRSGYDDPISQGVIRNLEALGTQTSLVCGDITNVEDIRKAFNSTSRPVSGIIQGAMVLCDKMFPQMSVDDFRVAIPPKVQGTWNLHNVSTEQVEPLDFFTVLTSVSGLSGLPGQTNYDAANVFQDAFVAYRNRLGLAANAVNLGVIDDVGYLTEHQRTQDQLVAKGLPLINEAILHRIMRLSLLQQSTNPVNPASKTQLITGIPVPLMPTPALRAVHRFSALGPKSSGPVESGNDDLTILKNASKGSKDVDQAMLMAAAVEVINGVLMKSLGLTESLEYSRPLAAYGIDSLVAVELRNWVRFELGVEISAVEVVGAKTLVSLCEVIVKKL